MSKAKQEELATLRPPDKKKMSELTAGKKRKQAAFLAAFRELGTLAKASRAARITRRQHYNWMNRDPEYVEQFTEAQEEANELLEAEARRRAVEGWKEPVFYEGEVCGHKHKYSDSLLIFLLKGNLPEKFKERFEHSGDPDKPIGIQFDLSKLSDEELKTLENMMEKMEENGN